MRDSPGVGYISLKKATDGLVRETLRQKTQLTDEKIKEKYHIPLTGEDFWKYDTRNCERILYYEELYEERTKRIGLKGLHLKLCLEMLRSR